jgi:hypothetical protein
MSTKIRTLSSSLSGLVEHCPVETLDSESRYVIAADLRMGDGGKHDDFSRSMRALYKILGNWYLRNGYTLVLNGDIENLQAYWIKDIFAAWPKMYALFDAFAEKGLLRKVVGERDLTLLKLRSYPYETLHGLRLESQQGSILITHGHQASRPYLGRDYMSDYIQSWIRSSRRFKEHAANSDCKGSHKVEQRLYKAAARIGMVLIEGHTRRPLFESITNRDAVRIELEKLLREGDPHNGENTINALIDYCRKEARLRSQSGSRLPTAGPGIEHEGIGYPNLFCSGRVAGNRGIRLLEIDDGHIRFVRWSKNDKNIPPPNPHYDENSSYSITTLGSIDGTSYRRFVIRSVSIDKVFERILSIQRTQNG